MGKSGELIASGTCRNRTRTEIRRSDIGCIPAQGAGIPGVYPEIDTSGIDR